MDRWRDSAGPRGRRNWDEVLRLTTSIRQGTVTASLMLRKHGSYPRQNGLALALREIGRIERMLFILDWLQNVELRRRAHVGQNKGEARNALAPGGVLSLSRRNPGPQLLTTILANAINLGLTKMAEACSGTAYAKLAWLQAWHIRDETYSQALAELVNAQHVHPFALHWGDGTTSSSHGQCYASAISALRTELDLASQRAVAIAGQQMAMANELAEARRACRTRCGEPNAPKPKWRSRGGSLTGWKNACRPQTLVNTRPSGSDAGCFIVTISRSEGE